MLGEFTEHEAIPLSIATVFGASCFSTIGNFIWLKHPMVAHRPMIAYDAALVLLPSTLLGSTAGVFVNKLCPNWMIVALLVALCAYSGRRTITQAFKRREREDREMGGAYKTLSQSENGGGTELATATAAEDDDAEDGATDPKASGGTALSAPPVPVSDGLLRSAQLAEEVARESRFPYTELFSLGRTWLAVMLLSLLKGGHGAPSLLGVTCGTPGYWTVVSLNIPVLGCLTLIAGRILVARHERRQACGYQYVEGDVQWDHHKVWLYSRYVGGGAIAAGMLGVGGGMILGPIFNELNFLPQVSSATSTIMVFFMASANVGQFIVFGMLDMQYALFYGTVGVLGAIVGTKGAKSIIERTGRASFLVFFLAAILLGSGVLMAAAGIPQILKTGLTGFRPICGRAGAAARSGD